jgi:xanthine dehydrogenase accessory factor
MSRVIQSICDMLIEGENVVMATLVNFQGKARLNGAKMLVRADGVSLGTIGGGFLENETLSIASELFMPGAPRIRILEFSGEGVTNMQTPCGKGTEVFIEHIAANPENLQVYRRLLAARQNGVKCWLFTSIGENGNERIAVQRSFVCEDGSVTGEIACLGERLPALLEKVLAGSSPVFEQIGEKRFFVDPWTVPSTVYLFGAGHVAQEVAELTAKAGFRTIVLDDREKFANPERFPTADGVMVLSSFEDCFQGLIVNDDSYLVIVTRGRRFEKTVLKQAIRTKAGYIGVIGSIRKRDALFRELSGEGFSIDELLRLYCPIGINILAEAPVEIAVSIVSQLILLRAQKKAAKKPHFQQLPAPVAVQT